MLTLILAGLAGALIMGVAVECWRTIEAVERERDAARSRRRIQRELDRHR